jgi:Tfp pilus assembly protein PilF
MINQEGIQKKNLNLILICLALVLLTIIAFWPVKSCDFINLDDNAYVYENVHVQQGLSWKSIQWAFSVKSVTLTGNWHPVTWLSLMLDHEFFGLNPYGYHLTNLFFHILNAILLFLIFHWMTRALWQSAFIAALFAIHPLHVESVAWVTERKDVLSTFFWMLTMGAYIFYTEKKNIGIYIMALFFFVFGLMAKAMLVTLPFVFILLDYWPLGRLKDIAVDGGRKMKGIQIRYLILEKIPFFILALLFSIITYFAQGTAFTSIIYVPLAMRLENVARSYVMYLSKAIWPSNLAIFYPHPENIVSWQVVGAISILGIITGLIILKGKHYPYLLMGWLWYLGTSLPVIGIIQIGYQAYADRYTYVPLIGIFIMITWGISILLKRKPHHKIFMEMAAGILLIVMVIISRNQVNYWRNSKTLMTHALTVTQNNYLAHACLGNAQLSDGLLAEATYNVSEAVRINPYYAPAQNLCVKLLRQQGMIGEALKHATEAVKITPNDYEAYNNLGNVLSDLKRYEGAMEAYNKALEIVPDFAETHNNIGTLMFSQGRIAEALGHYKIALQINPDLLETRYNIALISASMGKLDKARDQLQGIIQLRPNLFQAHYLLGKIAATQGRYDEAVQHFQDTLRLRPDFERAKHDLKNALALQRKMH